MPITQYYNGVGSFGIPLTGQIPIHVPNNIGKVFFVDAGRGSDGNDGSFERPFATITKALSCAAYGRGDIIYVFPGSYTETVSVTGKDYINIIGIQIPGYAKPDIVPTTGKGINSTTSQGLVLRHLRVYSADDDTVYNEGNGFLFEDCVFDGDTGQAATECLVRLRGNASDDSYTASEGIIRGCHFRNSNGIGLIFDTGSAPGNGVGCTDNIIAGNRFYANAGADIATKDSGSGVYSVHTTLIVGNHFETKNKATYIDLTTENGGAAGDQTGAINGNFFAADAITAGNEVKMVGTGFTFTGNFNTVGVKDGSGLD